MRYRLMATYRGVPYEAGVGPSGTDVVLFAACPPPEELGFEPAPGHWRKQVVRAEVDALWESRPVGVFRGEPCIVLDDLGDRLHIAYLATDPGRAAALGYWQVDRGVFELIAPRDEVTGLAEERVEKPLRVSAPAVAPGPPAYPYGTAPWPAVPVPAPPPPGTPPQGIPLPGTPPQGTPPQGIPLPGTPPQGIPLPGTPLPGSWHPLPAAPDLPGSGLPPAPVGPPDAGLPGSGLPPAPAEPPDAGLPGSGLPPAPAEPPDAGLPDSGLPPAPAGVPAGAAAAAPGDAATGGDMLSAGLPQPAYREPAPWDGASPAVTGRPPSPEPGMPAPHSAVPASTLPQRTPPAGFSVPPDPSTPAAAPAPAGIPVPPGPSPLATATAPGTAPPPEPGTRGYQEPPPPAAQPQPARRPGRRRAARRQRVTTRAVFCELADLAAIPRHAYSLEAETDGAMCLLPSATGYEVFLSADGARHEVRAFADEEAAYFYLFGVLAAEAVRGGELSPQRPA